MSLPTNDQMDGGLTHTLRLARSGDSEAASRLLSLCRNYVHVHARRQMESQLSPRTDASDIVQQTLLDAWRGLEGFRGTSSAELLSWLKQIVSRNSIDAVRHHAAADKRCVRREVSLGSSPGDTSMAPMELASADDTPSECLMKCEQELLLADAIAQLPDDYQQVLICRSLQRMPFAEVAERMERSRPAVQMLWARAVEQLRMRLNAEGHERVDAPVETA